MPVSLVFGASGAVGRFLVPRLLAAGHEVVAISREPRASRHRALSWIVGRLPESVPPLPAHDTIYSLGPLDVFAQWLAGHRAGPATRIVAVGSLSAQTKKDSSDPAERALAERLADAEATLARAAGECACAATVLRASLIYGAGLDRSLTPIVRFARRWRVFPRMNGAAGLRQPVHAEDLASACLAVAAMPVPAHRVYAVGGGERIAFATMLARVRASLPIATLAVPVPTAIARAGIRMAHGAARFPAASAAALARMNEDLVADNAAAAADFGFAPRGFAPRVADWTPPPLP